MSAKGRLLSALAAAVVMFAASQSALAYATFFGQDTSPTPGSAATYANSLAARADFLSQLSGVGSEDFEQFAPGAKPPRGLSFPGAGSATLGGSGNILNGNSGGRFATSGDQYWSINVTSGSFHVLFDAPVAAFGFFAVDVGDFGGRLSLRLTNAKGKSQLVVPHGTTDGAVLYFGLIAESIDEGFSRIDFHSRGGIANETFAFDDMTIASPDQVCRTDCRTLPEPGSLPLVLGALSGLAWLARRRVD